LDASFSRSVARWVACGIEPQQLRSGQARACVHAALKAINLNDDKGTNYRHDSIQSDSTKGRPDEQSESNQHRGAVIGSDDRALEGKVRVPWTWHTTDKTPRVITLQNRMRLTQSPRRALILMHQHPKFVNTRDWHRPKHPHPTA